ncbi:predicted protein [Sclerotinia sclerotiorum 1980 UF-70]|uniref:Uncharacterized protein n=2 Tax=Sclerotinia sclerotiorum (strain ATCC 18683 / 1980 / Ss-1) TaxID=665079 RepID=A7F5S4_SCLS1|nr:predicted protein [Sclerotinia sclerotiorum 1980 UF-70]APA06392.1 hypothetical protein sscle_02g011620 [Sclerotinia sclerotiorum 1980 UF-70]EDN98095.1 predicted protein [Sclerotinia sclerotiorum 1980 UF-70]
MNNIGHRGGAVPLGRSSKVVICPTADYEAPTYICYDYICPHCPSGNQGNQLIYLPQPSSDELQNAPAPLVYTRLYHDFRYQVYAIDSSPTIQRTWYHGEWNKPIRGVLQDDRNQAFTGSVTGHTVIHPSPLGYTIHPEANCPVGDSAEAAFPIVSSQTEKGITTPNLRVSSSRSMSSESSCLLLTPRSNYNTASTYRLPVDFQNQVEEVNEGEVEDLRREGAVFVSELNDNDRTPTRDNFGGSRGNEGEGREGAAAIVPQRVTAGSDRVNGAGNINPPHGPRRGGNGGGQNRGRGGRPARVWNWHN